MADIPAVGRLLVAAGLTIAAVGLFLMVAGRVPGLDRLGRLPGDFTFQCGPVTVAAPIVSSLLISIVLTIALNLFLRR